MFNELINSNVQLLVLYSTNILMPFMVIVFLVGILIRMTIYFTIKSESGFIFEFEKRVHKYLADPNYEHGTRNFNTLTKRLLERTYEDHYNLKKKFRRRRFDQLTCVTDRIFMIPEGAMRLMLDTLSQTKYLRKEGRPPKFLDIAKWAFESNPVFNRVLGVFSMGMFHDVLNILPGLFVIGGIFGTFLGVMQALPMLGEMNIADLESTKKTMDGFLLNMAFSMGTSVVGIVFSVSMTILNSIMNPDDIYYKMVNRFSSSLEFLWNDTITNIVLAEEVSSLDVDRRGISYSNLSDIGEAGTFGVGEVKKTSSVPDTSIKEVDRVTSDAGVLPKENDVLVNNGNFPQKEGTVLNISEQFVSSLSSVEEILETEYLNRASNEVVERLGKGEKGDITTEPESVEVADAGSVKENTGFSGYKNEKVEVAQELSACHKPEAQSVDLKEKDVSTELGNVGERTPVSQISPEDSWMETAIPSQGEPGISDPVEQVYSEADASMMKELSQVDEMFRQMDAALSKAESDVGFKFADKFSFPEEDSMMVGRPRELSLVSDEQAHDTLHEDVAKISFKDKQEIVDRLEILKFRLGVLDKYLIKADEDRLTGVMNEEMWKDETSRYALEKEKVQNEIEQLEENENNAA